MKIVVLAGGLSTERQVSLTSGTGVCRALRERGHKAILVDMFMGFEDYDGKLEDVFDAPNGFCGDYSVAEAEPDLAAVRASRKDQSKSLFGPDVLDVCAKADVVFLALHGTCGEDGRVQAAFDLLGRKNAAVRKIFFKIHGFQFGFGFGEQSAGCQTIGNLGFLQDFFYAWRCGQVVFNFDFFASFDFFPKIIV